MPNIYEIRSEDGDVVNTIIADEAFVEEHYWGLYTLIGPAPEPVVQPTVPDDITDRQFFEAIATPPWSLIEQSEAIAAVQTGTIPAAMQAIIDGFPEEQKFKATMLIAGAQQFLRTDPLVAAFGAAFGMTPAQIDDLWIFAKQL